MTSAATTREAPSYSSSRVQRAARLNNVEATKLLQQLQYLDKAKQHQTRLTNQDIRLVSMSIDYIQAHSGNSQEGWRPPVSPKQEPDDVKVEAAVAEPKPEGPCFMYGERIISRKIRRLTRPMSAVERSSYGKSQHYSYDDDDATSTSTYDDSVEGGSSIHNHNNNNNNNNNHNNHIPRPKSCNSNNSSSSRNKNVRPSSSMSWVKLNNNDSSNYNRDNSPERGADSSTPMPTTARSGYIYTSRPSSAVSSTAHVEREPWEDDTYIITKKILKSQARAQMGKRDSVYQTAGAVMNSQSSKKVRDLARKIRINATQVDLNGFDPSISRHSHPGVFEDKPPKRPSTAKDFLGRRATFGEIMSQQKPTLSAGAWRQHLSKTSQGSPMSATAQHRVMFEAKKNLNDTRRADVADKVKDFMGKNNS